MIKDSVKEYAKREFAVALDMMSENNECFHAFDLSTGSDGKRYYLCLMILPDDAKEKFVEAILAEKIVGDVLGAYTTQGH